MLVTRLTATLLLGLILGLGAMSGAQTSQDQFVAAQWPDRSLWPRGRFVFQKQCVVCHGRFGQGDGEMTPGMLPKPRDLTKGVFKFRSTPSGFLPTTSDLRRTVEQGLSGSAMPSFAGLPERDLEAVVEYVKSFSLRWRQSENYAPPIRIPPEPAWFNNAMGQMRHAEAGRQTFLLACASCHGEDGHGRTNSAMPWTDQADETAEPFKAPDLTQPILRSGPNRRDLYRTLTTGIDGTPMPSFQEALTEGQVWELIAFLETLKGS